MISTIEDYMAHQRTEMLGKRYDRHGGHGGTSHQCGSSGTKCDACEHDITIFSELHIEALNYKESRQRK